MKIEIYIYIYKQHQQRRNILFHVLERLPKDHETKVYEMPTFSKPRPFVKGALPVAISAASTC
jgi:hypothetical protein